MTNCVICGRELFDDAVICQDCYDDANDRRKRLSPSRHCINCGAEIEDDDPDETELCEGCREAENEEAEN